MQRKGRVTGTRVFRWWFPLVTINGAPPWFSHVATWFPLRPAVVHRGEFSTKPAKREKLFAEGSTATKNVNTKPQLQIQAIPTNPPLQSCRGYLRTELSLVP